MLTQNIPFEYIEEPICKRKLRGGAVMTFEGLVADGIYLQLISFNNLHCIQKTNIVYNQIIHALCLLQYLIL